MPTAEASEHVSHTLHVAGTAVAAYVVTSNLPAEVSPRPYFHPVRTLGGLLVTETLPPDHLHHLGVSVAIPEAGGVNFWGGRTYTTEHGYQWLDNHGEQRHLAWHDRDDDRVDQTIGWFGRDAGPVLTERRTVSVRGVDGTDAWCFDLVFVLTNDRPEPVELRSPTCNGRPDAGYGGFFWRVPKLPGDLAVLTAAHDDVDAAYGTSSDWLAMNGATEDGERWSLLFVQESDDNQFDPWFVRTAVNPGVGTCVAWSTPAVLPPGGSLRRSIRTVVIDGATDRRRSRDILDRLPPAHGAR